MRTPRRLRPAGTSRSAAILTTTALTAAVLGAACAGTTAEQVETRSASHADDASTGRSATTSTTQPPDCASMLPSAGQAAQLLMLVANDPLNAQELVADGTVGGIALVEGQRTDVGARISQAVADAPLPVTVAVDEEGGTVQRLKNAAGKLASAADMAEGTPQEAAELMGSHAARMRELGVTMNLAPVADVGEDTALGSRVFGADPMTVSGFVTAVVEAQSAEGIVPVVKHWPGIGSTDEDPHDGLGRVDPIEELRARDLLPFERAIEVGVPAVMVGHVVVPGLTEDDQPASLSPAAIGGELRGREGFDGVVVTDDLGMAAIELPQDEAAVAAIAAGADLAMVSGSDAAVEVHDRLTEAIDDGTLDARQVEASVRRVLELKGVDGECFDAVSAYAEAARLQSPDPGTDGSTTTEATDTPGGRGSASTSTTVSSTTATGGRG